jgi:hypothetical protein
VEQHALVLVWWRVARVACGVWRGACGVWRVAWRVAQGARSVARALQCTREHGAGGQLWPRWQTRRHPRAVARPHARTPSRPPRLCGLPARAAQQQHPPPLCPRSTHKQTHNHAQSHTNTHNHTHTHALTFATFLQVAHSFFTSSSVGSRCILYLARGCQRSYCACRFLPAVRVGAACVCACCECVCVCVLCVCVCVCVLRVCVTQGQRTYRGRRGVGR